MRDKENTSEILPLYKSIIVLSSPSYEFNNDKVTSRFGPHWRSYDGWFFSTGDRAYAHRVFVIGQSLYQVSISIPQYNRQWRLQSDSEEARSSESVSPIIIFYFWYPKSHLQTGDRPNDVTFSDRNQSPKYFRNILTTAWCIVFRVIICTKWVKVGAIYLHHSRHGGATHTIMGRQDSPQSVGMKSR